MNQPNRIDKDALLELCMNFFKDNGIHCAETIGQMDHVIVNAYDFIEEIGNIIGYVDVDE